MKTSHALLILGAGALAVLYYKKKQIVKPAPLSANTGGYSPSQPSQQYPVTAVVGPRVDNQSQPWVASQTKSVLSDISQNVGAVASAAKSVKGLWDDISGFFGTDDVDAKQNLVSADNLFSLNDNVNFGDAGSLFQSDSVGGELSYEMGQDYNYA